MKLYKIFNYLDIERSKYSKWAKFILNSYDEGTHYNTYIEDNQKYYDIVPALAVIILDKYNIDVSIIKDIMLQDEDLTKLVSNIKLDEDYHYMISHVKRILHTNFGVPEGYSMPSEVGLNHSKLVNLGLVDFGYNITEEGHKYLKIRPIIKKFEVEWHVVINDLYSTQLSNTYISSNNINVVNIQEPKNNNKNWTKEDYKTLIKLNKQGYSNLEIAEIMERTAGSIKYQLRDLVQSSIEILEPTKPIESEPWDDL